MNLLFLSTVFPDDNEPSRGTYNRELCGALAAEHRVRVVSPRGWTEALRQTFSGRRYSSSMVLRGTGIVADYPTYWYPPRISRERYGDFLWKSSRQAVTRLCGDNPPQAVLSYWAHPDGEAGLRAAQAYGVPSAVIVGGSDILLLPNCPKRGARVRHVLKESDAVITISHGLREKVIELGIDPSHVHTIAQGINTELFHSSGREASRARLAVTHAELTDECPVLLWVGRMVDLKRLDVLVDAAVALRATGREFVLCLVGDGPERGTIASLVRKHRLERSVVFAGAMPPDALGDWYRAADLTVISSESEGLPNVLRESLACGTPFVSTHVGSIAEIADERYSVLVPPHDALALAQGIEQVLDGSHQSNALEDHPRTWPAMAAEIVSLFEHCGAGNRAIDAREGMSCHAH